MAPDDTETYRLLAVEHTRNLLQLKAIDVPS